MALNLQFLSRAAYVCEHHVASASPKVLSALISKTPSASPKLLSNIIQTPSASPKVLGAGAPKTPARSPLGSPFGSPFGTDRFAPSFGDLEFTAPGAVGGPAPTPRPDVQRLIESRQQGPGASACAAVSAAPCTFALWPSASLADLNTGLPALLCQGRRAAAAPAPPALPAQGEEQELWTEASAAALRAQQAFLQRREHAAGCGAVGQRAIGLPVLLGRGSVGPAVRAAPAADERELEVVARPTAERPQQVHPLPILLGRRTAAMPVPAAEAKEEQAWTTPKNQRELEAAVCRAAVQAQRAFLDKRQRVANRAAATSVP